MVLRARAALRPDAPGHRWALTSAARVERNAGSDPLARCASGGDDARRVPARVPGRHGGDVPGRRRPDDPRERAARDREFAGRHQRPVVGRRRLPARGDRRRAAVRLPGRPVRPAPHAAGRARRVHAGVGRLRVRAELPVARAVSRAAGAGRRRPHDARAVADRRARVAARARPVRGLLRDGVRAREHDGARARRVSHRALQLARGVPDQRAARHRRRRARAARAAGADAGAAGPVPAGRRRRRPVLRDDGDVPVHALVGRPPVPVAVVADGGAARVRRRRVRGARRVGATASRPAAAAASPPGAGDRAVGRGRHVLRRRALLRDPVPAALPAARARHGNRRVGRIAAADHARAGGLRGGDRAARHAHGPRQRLSARGSRAGDRRVPRARADGRAALRRRSCSR